MVHIKQPFVSTKCVIYFKSDRVVIHVSACVVWLKAKWSFTHRVYIYILQYWV